MLVASKMRIRSPSNVASSRVGVAPMRACLATFALATFAAPAGADECSSLAPMRWLLGEWLAEGEKSTWRERWSETGPATWEGRGIETSGSDPARSSSEALRMVEMGGGVFYVAKVAHNELPVAFRLVECGAGRLVFANPAHDFPRRLEYTRTPGDRLRVRVSDGGAQGFTLDFARQAEAAADAEPVLAAEDLRFAAMVNADAQAMRRAFAEDLRYVHTTGDVDGREALIESIVSGRRRYLAIEPGERQVSRPGAGVAAVTGVARMRVAAGADELEFRARYLAVYAVANGAWTLRAWQSLRLP